MSSLPVSVFSRCCHIFSRTITPSFVRRQSGLVKFFAQSLPLPWKWRISFDFLCVCTFYWRLEVMQCCSSYLLGRITHLPELSVREKLVQWALETELYTRPLTPLYRDCSCCTDPDSFRSWMCWGFLISTCHVTLHSDFLCVVGTANQCVGGNSISIGIKM